MRQWMLAGVLLGSLMGLPGWAQDLNYPAVRSVAVPQVEVRSGPTAQSYPTSLLRQGDQVVVVKELRDQPGWLAIKPPAGSFSWIQGKHILQVDAQTGVVKQENVPVRPGSSLPNQNPNIEMGRLPLGYQITIVGRAVPVEGENWLPIKPTENELRFIPASAINERVAVSPGLPNTPNFSGFPNTLDANYLIQQADQAYIAGNFDQARQLYRDVVERSADANLRAYAQNRLNQLQPTAQANWQPAGGVGKLTSQSSYNQPMTGETRWSEWGVLRQAGFRSRDGQQVFALEIPGKSTQYVIPKVGTSLQNYLGRQVCLFGQWTLNYDNQPPVPILIASHVAVP